MRSCKVFLYDKITKNTCHIPEEHPDYTLLHRLVGYQDSKNVCEGYQVP